MISPYFHPPDWRRARGVTTAVLNWAGSDRVQGYTVFRNGVAIGQTAETRFSVAGLTEATGYVFTVAAVDAAGRLAKSPPVALLTQAFERIAIG